MSPVHVWASIAFIALMVALFLFTNISHIFELRQKRITFRGRVVPHVPYFQIIFLIAMIIVLIFCVIYAVKFA